MVQCYQTIHVKHEITEVSDVTNRPTYLVVVTLRVSVPVCLPVCLSVSVCGWSSVRLRGASYILEYLLKKAVICEAVVAGNSTVQYRRPIVKFLPVPWKRNGGKTNNETLPRPRTPPLP